MKKQNLIRDATTDLLSLYLADCQLEHLEYNDSTYQKAIELAKMLGMSEAKLNK